MSDTKISKPNVNTVAIHGGSNHDETGSTVAPIWQSTAFAYNTAQELADVFDNRAPRFHLFADCESEFLCP